MKSQSLLAIVVVGLLVCACGEESTAPSGTNSQSSQPADNSGAKDDSTTQQNRPGDGSPDSVQCGCSEGEFCVVSRGTRLTESGQCGEEEVFTSCRDYEEECYPVYSYAQNPSGELWVFANSCTPTGWWDRWYDTPVDESCLGDPSTIDCARLGMEECSEHGHGCSALWGRPVNEHEQCFLAKEFVACVTSAHRTCGAAIWSARDPSNKLWVFMDTCIPPSWSDEGGSTDIYELCP